MSDENIENPTTEQSIRAFMQKYRMFQNELDTIKEAQKDLIEEFEDRLDTKVLKQAIRAAKIKKKVNAMQTFEEYCEVLDTEVV